MERSVLQNGKPEPTSSPTHRSPSRTKIRSCDPQALAEMESLPVGRPRPGYPLTGHLYWTPLYHQRASAAHPEALVCARGLRQFEGHGA